MRNDNYDFDPDTDECPDFDFTEVDHDITTSDEIDDCWLTDDALDILNALHRKRHKEDAIISAGVIAAIISIIALSVAYSIWRYI